MTQKHIGAARGAARAGASGDPKATLQYQVVLLYFCLLRSCQGMCQGMFGTDLITLILGELSNLITLILGELSDLITSNNKTYVTPNTGLVAI